MGSEMRIGIITFHSSYNFGSALQAYAMQTAIEGLGHVATIIDYQSRDWEQYGLISLRHPRRSLRVFKNLSGYYGRRAAFDRFSSSFLRLTENRYSYKDEEKLEDLQADFDCFVCGSDQIWNLDCTHGIVEPFFLSFAGDKRRVAYAPSLAHTSFKPENFDEAQVAGLLAAFDFISIREVETLPLFQPLVDKLIDVVIDPTLLLNVADYKRIVSAPPVEGGYIFMYLLRECAELVESTVAMAGLTGKKVAYVSERNLSIPNSVNLFGIGPSEFLSAIAHADAVMANSFHAAVFSTLFHKPFRVFATDGSGARMRDLLGDLGIGERCVDRVESSPITDVDWDGVERRLAALRVHSLDYLGKALS